MKKYHTILSCGHWAVLPKGWTICKCATCGTITEVLK